MDEKAGLVYFLCFIETCIKEQLVVNNILLASRFSHMKILLHTKYLKHR